MPHLKCIHKSSSDRKLLSRDFLTSNPHQNHYNNASSFSQIQKTLIVQLKSQISDLLPLKYNFNQLINYYQKLNNQYQQLSKQLLQEKYVYNRFRNTNREFKEDEVNLEQKLKEVEIRYQELSSYLNQHLIPEKMVIPKKENKQLCEKFALLQRQLDQTKSRLKECLNKRDLTINPIQKDLQIQRQMIQPQFAKSKYRLQSKNLQLSEINIQIQVFQRHKSLLKQKEQKFLINQSALLERMTSNKQQNQRLKASQKQLKQSLINLTKQKQLQKQQNEKVQRTLKKVNQENIVLYQKKSQIQQQNIQMGKNIEISEIQIQRLLQKKQQIDQKQSANCLSVNNDLLSENQKNKKFLAYLQKYEEQLKETSRLMYQKLQQSCKQDYEKLLVSRTSTKPLNNIPIPSDIIQNQKIDYLRMISQKQEQCDFFSIKHNMERQNLIRKQFSHLQNLPYY